MSFSFTGAGGTTSATIPTHAAGDLILAFAYRDGNNAPPTVPSGQNWTTVFNSTGANTNGHAVAAKIAASSSETTGTFTNASRLEIVVVKTDVSGGTIGYKNGASGGGSSTTLSFTGFTLDNPTSTSRIIAFAGHRSVNTSTETAPTGFTNINSGVDATAEAASHHSTSTVSSFSTTTQSVGGTSSGWRTHTMEVWEITPDTTAPTLTSPTGTEVGGTGYSGTVSTNEGNGTLYRWVTQNATETAANVVSNGASQAVTASGVQNVSGSGLSPSTSYYIHYVHVDAASNQSSRVSSSQFTTLSTVTIVISENTGADFSSVPDARILEYAASTNYGTDGTLWIGGFEAAVIRFDGLIDSSLDGGTVSGAVLRFKQPYDKSATTDLVIAKLASAFDESTVTWANVGSSTNIGTFAYGGSGDILINGSWLDAYIQDVIDGVETNNGLRIYATDGYALTNSSEADDGDRPSLTFDAAFSGGDTDIDCAIGTAAASGLTAAIDQQQNFTCAIGTATASGLSASVDQQQNITCSIGTATATGLSASIDSQVDINCAIGTADATGLTASIGGATTIQCEIGTAAASGLTAAIDQQQNITCAIGTATASGLSASIDQQQNITCSIGTAAASGLTATLTSDTTVTCSVGVAEASGLSAAIDQQQDITCSVGTAVASGLTATLGGDTTITCSIGTAVASGLSAMIDRQVNILCSIGTAIASGLEVSFEAEGRLKQAIKEAYASAPAGTIIIHTLEFRHPNFRDQFNQPTAIRVVLGHQNLEAKLEDSAPQNAGEYVVFIPMAFELELPNVEHLAVPEISISMDNVSRDIEDNLTLAAASPYKVEVTYRPYLNTDLTQPQMNPPLTMTLISAEADDFRVSARATYGNASNVLAPRELYTADRFPGLQR